MVSKTTPTLLPQSARKLLFLIRRPLSNYDSLRAISVNHSSDRIPESLTNQDYDRRRDPGIDIYDSLRLKDHVNRT